MTADPPTDAAFEKLPAGALEGLLADRAKLRQVLLYHVVAGRVTSGQVAGLSSARTVAGPSVRVRVMNGTPMIDEAHVVAADVGATNGVIHVIDTVLLPPAAWDQWLEPANHDVETLGLLLVPAPPTLLTTHPVSPRVGNVRNKDSALVEPFDPDGTDPGGTAG